MEKYVIYVNGEEYETFEADSLEQAEEYMVNHYAYYEARYGDGSVELVKESK